MGILSALRLTRAANEGPSPLPTSWDQLAPPDARQGIVSPWATGTLNSIVAADALGGAELAPVTRAEAMSVPSVVKARHLLVTHIARYPLTCLDAAGPVADQPTWLHRTDGTVSPWHRMAWTVDDLLFRGWSLWAVEREVDEPGATITNAARVPVEWWKIDRDGYLSVRGERPKAHQVILIPGPAEGLLEYGARTIRAARHLETTVAGRVRAPIPTVELHQTDDDQLEDSEIDELIATYVKARNDPNGAVVYTPHNIDLRPHGEAKADMLVEARNAVRLDVANYTGLPAAALDGSLSTASLTYTTQEGKRTELGDALPLFMDPIAARLSQDDVVPGGRRVRFDLTDAVTTPPAPLGPTMND